MSAEKRYTKEEMDKRDMFACAVLAALVGTPDLRGDTLGNVEYAYYYADAMMKERLK